jgi:hypothetical protein
MPSSGMWRRVDLVGKRRFGGTYRLHLQGRKIFEPHMAHPPSLPVLIQLGVFNWWLCLLATSHEHSSLTKFSTLKMEAIHSSETSVHTRSTQCHIPEDSILHSHRHEKPQLLHELGYFRNAETGSDFTHIVDSWYVMILTLC